MSNVSDSIKTNSIILENNNLNKINFEKEENNLRNKYDQENIFISPIHKIKWQSEDIQGSYHFKQDIERIWLIIRGFDLVALINNKGHYPCICTKGQNTWQVGNEFKGNLFSAFPFIARVEKSESLPEIKIVKWLFNIKYKDYAKIKFELFKVTEDNTCVLTYKIKLENPEHIKIANEQQNSEPKNKLFENIEKLLESEPINLFQYESGIINAKMKDIWEMLTDFNKLTLIAPNNNCLPNINIGNMKQGEKVTFSGFCEGKAYEIDITLEYKDERPGWNKWIIILLISGGVAKTHPNHSVILELTKISEQKCQLIYVSKFHDSIDTKKFQDISRRKKYLLYSLKDYFDNFYSQSNSN